MTVPSSVAKSGPYLCNGVTDVFNYDFRIVDKAHLNVILADADGVESALVLATHYTVSDVGDDNGSINLTSDGVALAVTGTKLTILRNPPFTQETDLQNQGAYLAETVEDRFDLAVMQIQTVKEKVDRAIVIPASDDSTTGDQLSADVARLAASADNIDTAAQNIDAINTASDNIAAIIDAPNQAQAASDSATAAATSAGNAAGSDAAAEAAADRAEAAADGLNLPTIGSGDAGRVLSVKEDGTGYVARPAVVDTLTDLAALTAADVRPGTSVELRFGDTYGGGGPRDFLAVAGTAMDNFGIPPVDKVIVENDAGDITFVRADWYENNHCNLRWFFPALDGVSDSAPATTAWYEACNKLAALRGTVLAKVPRRAKFLTSATILVASGFILMGGGKLEAHPDMPQGKNLIQSALLTAGFNNYAQDYIEIRDIDLSGGNRMQTVQRQALVRIYSTRRVVIGDNVTAHDNQSHLLAFAGNGSLSVTGSNIELYNWGHPSNGIAITDAADNGSGAIRLTVSSTATMATGDTRIVNGVEGVTNANGSWTVTVIDATHVDLQGSTFAGVFSGTTGKLSSSIDGGSALICLYNPIDNTPQGNVQIGNGVYIHDGNWNGIQMNATGYIIDGVRIRNSRETGIFARQESSTNQSSEGIISGCNISGVRRAYIDANGITAGGARVKILGNMVSNCDYAGISAVSEQFDMDIEGNTIINGNNDPVQFPGGAGITVRDVLAGGGPRYVRINNNTVRDIKGSKTAAYGIRVFVQAPGTAMNDVEITNNTLTESSAVAGDELEINPNAVGVRWRVRNNVGAPDLYDISSRTLLNSKRCFWTTFRAWSRSVRLPVLHWDRRSACVWT